MHLPGHSSPLDFARATLKAAEGLSELVSAEFADEFSNLFTCSTAIIDSIASHHLNRSSEEVLAKSVCDTVHLAVIAASDPRAVGMLEIHHDIRELTIAIEAIQVHLATHFQKFRIERAIRALNASDAKVNDQFCKGLETISKNIRFSQDILNCLGVRTSKEVLAVSSNRLVDAIQKILQGGTASQMPFLVKLSDGAPLARSRSNVGRAVSPDLQRSRTVNSSGQSARSAGITCEEPAVHKVFPELPNTEEPESFLPTPLMVPLIHTTIETQHSEASQPPPWFRPSPPMQQPHWMRSSTYSTCYSSDSPTEDGLPDTPSMDNVADVNVKISFPTATHFTVDSLESSYEGTFIVPFVPAELRRVKGH